MFGALRCGGSPVLGTLFLAWVGQAVPDGALTLDQALALTESQALPIRLADAEVRRARARVQAARAAGRFRADAGASASYTRANFGSQFPAVEGIATNADAAFNLPIDLSGGIRERIASATAALRVAEADFRAARNDAALQTRTAYLGALRSDALLKVAEASARLAEEQVEAARIQLRVEEIAPVDVSRLESLLAQRRAEVASARAASRNARFALARLLGVRSDALSTLADVAEPDPISDEPPALLSRALVGRPEIAAQSAAVEAAAALARAERAALRPSLNLQGSYQRNLSGPTGLGAQEQTVATLSIRFPLTDGGAARAAAQQAEEDRRQALARLDQLQADISAEVSTALSDLQSARERDVEARQQLDAARVVARGARIRRSGGLGTVLDVVDAEAQLRQAEQNAAVTRYDALIARAALDRALGADLRG